MTHSDNHNYAWSSPERALHFARVLAEVVIRQSPLANSDEEDQREETQRLRSVLQVFIEFTPVEAASLWKLKARADRASCIADTREAGTPNDAGFCDPGQSYVCNLHQPTIQAVLEHYRKSYRQASCDTAGGDYITEGEATAGDPILSITKDRLYMPFGRLCGPADTERPTPNYVVELYRTQDHGEPRNWGIPNDIFEATKSKLVSGICALVDRRLTRITRAMSNVTVSDANAGADYAIDKAINRVIPRFIRCERLIRFNQTSSGSYRVVQDRAISYGNEFPVRETAPLSREAVSALTALADEMFEGVDGLDTALVFEPALRARLPETLFPSFRNLMIAKLHSRSGESEEVDYLVLVNRLNDLSAEIDQRSVIEDAFDWEDELYLSHIALVIGFIKELFVAEETRLRRAHILAHEMHSPTEFIYATVQRIQDSVEGRREMPEQMVRRELSDILLTSELQTALIDSLMIGLEVSNLPPAKKYLPARVSLRNVADNISRMVIPICRKHGVNPTGITIRPLPDLIIDRRAITQIVLNLTTNAIKYSGSRAGADFDLLVYSENVDLNELSATSAPASLIARLKRLDVKRGYLITFRDKGIGVPWPFRERMFRPGARADDPEVVSKSGAGLGLSVVRTIMRDHFGDAWLERQADPTEIAIFFPDVVQSGRYRSYKGWLEGKDG